MKTKAAAKAKVESSGTAAEFKIWCEECCIRIAPFDERIVSKGKTYHARCYAKLDPAASDKTKKAAR
jgi:hypothetical protein